MVSDEEDEMSKNNRKKIWTTGAHYTFNSGKLVTNFMPN